ncbi:glycerol-3-phosphate dehydrogenase C-terminal domain-containing protein [Paraliobacillus ryukyuensis]|uniref:glycerol-3-phosphate dehydrogenase C-terminal domain-containing protein n=1 Tax=Paraliobacillus ryukyuensis TaxID=200904 RepID=UPI0009A6D526|nr:glycerol-3-phosphate dehydrogenase C-terminal domain-containing protein [Paraliobacillus ryukyuensis]
MLHSSSGLISIPTVEMNGFRKSAEIIVDHLVKQFKDEKGILYSSSETKSIPIAGGEVGGSQGFATFKQQQLQQTKDIPIDEATKERYIDRYGKNVEKIWTYYHQYQQSAQNYQVDTLLFAELNYTLEEECIYMPLDFFERRTGAIHFHSEVIKRNSDGVIAYLRDKLKWNTEETAYYKRELQLACH